jgi:hypothetical protein
MDSEGSLCSQEPSIFIYPDSVHLLTQVFNHILISFSLLHLGLPSGQSIATKILYAFLLFPEPAPCPSHPIVLDFIAVIIFCEEYKL